MAIEQEPIHTIQIVPPSSEEQDKQANIISDVLVAYNATIGSVNRNRQVPLFKRVLKLLFGGKK